MTITGVEEPQRLTVRWDHTMCCYRVNVPEWAGGDVVSAGAYDDLVAKVELGSALMAAERDQYKRERDEAHQLLLDLFASTDLRSAPAPIKTRLRDVIRTTAVASSRIEAS